MRLPAAAVALAAVLVSAVPQAVHAAGDTGGSHASDAACAGISGPMAMPATFSKYAAGDVTRSLADPAAVAKRRRQLVDIRAFVSDIEDLASRYAASDGGDLGSARCVMLRLGEWAAADGFLGLATEDAFLTRDTLVIDLARAYRLVEPAPVTDTDRAAIRAWFQRIANDTVAFYEYAAGPRTRANNHRYWAGVAVGTVGAMTDDPVLTRWAGDTLKLALCQVRADGALPLELARGRRAFEYHVYALRALTELNTVVDEVGRPDLAGCDGGLERLRAFSLAWAAGNGPNGVPPQETLPVSSRRFLEGLAQN
jgi:hypothetical protein